MVSRRRSGRRALWGGALVAVGAALAPWALPLPPLPGKDPRDLAAPTDRFAELDGVDVRYRTWGEAPFTFLLVHGFGSHADSWAPVAPGLAPSGGMVAFDRVGFGLTSRPDDPRRYDARTQVELARRLLDHLGVDRAAVLAHSAGCSVALGLALDHPHRVTALILEAPSLGAPPGWVRALAGTPPGIRLLRHAARRAADRLTWGLSDAYHDPTKLEEATIASYRRPLGVRDWDIGLARFVAARPLPDLRRRLTEVRVPTLVVTGDDDRWSPTEASIALAAGIPGAELAVTPRCGHVVHEECPQAFVQTVTDWLATLRP